MSAATGVPGEPAFGSLGWATFSPTPFRPRPGEPHRLPGIVGRREPAGAAHDISA